jgi:hypothetical protein
MHYDCGAADTVLWKMADDQYASFAWADSNYPAIKKTYMKTTQIVAMWTFGLGSLVPAQAFDILGMRSDPNTIQTATEASKLQVGAPLILLTPVS